MRGPIPGSGRSPGGRHGNSLQYSCLEIPMDREAQWAIVHGVTESDTTEVTEHTHTHTHTHKITNTYCALYSLRSNYCFYTYFTD